MPRQQAARGSVRLGRSVALHSHGSFPPQFASPDLCCASPYSGRQTVVNSRYVNIYTKNIWTKVKIYGTVFSMRIYLDHCAYNRPFDDQGNIKNQLETTAKLYIQNQIRKGKYDLVWSYMSDFENESNPNIRLVLEPGWFSNKSCKMPCILPFFSDCCSKTEVKEKTPGKHQSRAL
jgi:hypothetical protein